MRYDTTHVQGMNGLGDNIYQRAFVRNMPGVYITTPWPELYADLDVRCVRSITTLRTQAKNVARTQHQWSIPPAGARSIRINYTVAEMKGGGILDAMARQFGVPATQFDLPDFGPPPFEKDGRRVALVRPVTLRREWANPSRNPDPEYVYGAAAALMDRGYHVISVADLVQGAEWAVGRLPPAHTVVHKGEWSVSQLLAAARHANVIVGGVGWIVPAAISLETPTFVIFGGNGGNNGPDKILPSSGVDNIGWAMPYQFCRCMASQHNCNKDIYAFDRKFTQWLERFDL